MKDKKEISRSLSVYEFKLAQKRPAGLSLTDIEREIITSRIDALKWVLGRK